MNIEYMIIYTQKRPILCIGISLLSFSPKLRFIYRVSHETWQFMNSFKCLLPYAVLDINHFLQFILLTKNNSNIYLCSQTKTLDIFNSVRPEVKLFEIFNRLQCHILFSILTDTFLKTQKTTVLKIRICCECSLLIVTL